MLNRTHFLYISYAFYQSLFDSVVFFLFLFQFLFMVSFRFSSFIVLFLARLVA